MGKPRPAHAGGSTAPAERLAQAEADLAGLSPEKRAAAELELDELRQTARAQAEAERMKALALQEAANSAIVHGDEEAFVELLRAADALDAELAPQPESTEKGGE